MGWDDVMNVYEAGEGINKKCWWGVRSGMGWGDVCVCMEWEQTGVFGFLDWAG